MIGNPTVARYYQASQKLARTYGVCNIAVAHRVEDFSAQADDGTATAKQGAGLIADTQTQVLFQMPPDQAVLAGEVFGLSAREQGLLTRLAPGQALWRIGAHRAVVTHARARSELAICDTDGAMRG